MGASLNLQPFSFANYASATVLLPGVAKLISNERMMLNTGHSYGLFLQIMGKFLGNIHNFNFKLNIMSIRRVRRCFYI